MFLVISTHYISLIEVRLTAIRYAARDTNLYELSATSNIPLPPSEPGSHVDVHLPNGLVRQYSLTVPEACPPRYVLGIKRDPASRGGSAYIFEQLRVGQLLRISPPRNHFRLVDGAPHVVLVAGGIGITPIWCMAQRLRTVGASWELHYACRSRAEMAFREELQCSPHVHLHFDDESGGACLNIPEILATAPQHAQLYCCGPAPMLASFEAAAADRNPDQVHVERFAAKEAASLQGGFVVELARSQRAFFVPPGKSILQILREAGLSVRYSCEEGVCAECETVVISGTPDHRDSVLTETERTANRTMMICCSGSRSARLVLDL